ncbi:MAG: hypothetical protein PHQ12_09055, partial [Chthoniobacteraceae bacterium]|nr:hypothetical protein [Chthoniobacteraceae bacterium]
MPTVVRFNHDFDSIRKMGVTLSASREDAKAQSRGAFVFLCGVAVLPSGAEVRKMPLLMRQVGIGIAGFGTIGVG